MIDPTTLVPSAQNAPLEPYDELSRYRGLPLLSWVGTDGVTHVYVAARLLPQPASLAAISQYTVGQGDRIDNIAASQLGDPRWWWRIADANGALDPTDLCATPGAILRITLPAGVPGPSQG